MSGSFRETFLDVWECSEGPLRCPRVVERLSRKSGRGWEAHTDVREWTEDTGNVREWWEALTDFRECSGGPHECQGVVGRPSRMSSSGWEAHPDVRKWSRGHPKSPSVVERPSRMTVIGLESLPDVREWSKGYSKCPGVVGRPSQLSESGGRPSQMSGSCRESLSEVWEAIPEVCEWSGHPPGCP